MENINDKAKRLMNNRSSCKVCLHQFDSLQECLKHELLEHSFSKNPHKAKRNHIKATLDALKITLKNDLQTDVETKLDSCQRGEELNSILQLYCVDTVKVEECYRHIYTCLNNELQKIGNFGIYPFGSVANGLALKSSDIDIYIDINDYCDHTFKHFRETFNRVSRHLSRNECFAEVVPIRQARVPIIKCKHLPSGYSIDLNMSCPSSVHNTNFIRDLITRDSRLHQFFLFLKIWSKHLQINGRGGNMTSYCWITLAIFYLQNTSNSANDSNQSILPSMQQLQKDIAPDIVEGVNYAYNFEEMATLDKHHTARSLIEGFFCFYGKYDFMNNIISPFLGQTISRESFIDDKFESKLYKDQLRTLSIIKGVPALPLKVTQSMCVQDIFCLNLNVARSVTPNHFEYIRQCLACAEHICCTNISGQNRTEANLYKSLLYGITEELLKLETIAIKPTAAERPVSKATALSFLLHPSRSDMRALVMQSKEIHNDKILLHKLWTQHYMELIKDILVDIYKLDVQTSLPALSSKNQKLDDSGELTHNWLLNGSVDMWTARNFQSKNSLLFMEQQKKQTKKFQEERRQNSTFAVQLNAVLTINIQKEFSAIELKIQQMDSTSSLDVTKKTPLRKFFNNFKVGIQSFNFKEKLQKVYGHNVHH